MHQNIIGPLKNTYRIIAPKLDSPPSRFDEEMLCKLFGERPPPHRTSPPPTTISVSLLPHPTKALPPPTKSFPNLTTQFKNGYKIHF